MAFPAPRFRDEKLRGNDRLEQIAAALQASR
jgi:hypothetical protein